MWARLARSRSATSSPKTERPSRASDNALDRALAEAAGRKLANSSSRTTSRATLRPGLSIMSSHRRLAGGRSHGPALRSPKLMENGPRRVTRTRASPSPVGSLTAAAATAALSHGDRSQALERGTFNSAHPVLLLECAPADPTRSAFQCRRELSKLNTPG